jgi:uncharacterized protein (DUF305 family)
MSSRSVSRRPALAFAAALTFAMGATLGAQHQMKAMSDADFVHMMTKHHQGGIEMSKVEESKGSSAAVKALATKIRQGQERETAERASWTKRHAGTPSADAKSHDAMMQKEHQATMAKLNGASGNALDQLFASEMAKHHEMAIQMIDTATLKDPELRKMAEKMKAGQTAELKELRQHAKH